MSFEKFRDGDIGPTVIILSICAFFAVALSFVYNVTSPVIEAGKIKAENEARSAVLADAGSFTEIKGDFPENIMEAYKADNGKGYVFKAKAKGFEGDVVFMVGIDKNGNVAGINMFEHSETPGLGSKVSEEDYLSRYYGDVNPHTVDAVTGATRTSNALKTVLSAVKDAYSIAKEAA